MQVSRWPNLNFKVIYSFNSDACITEIQQTSEQKLLWQKWQFPHFSFQFFILRERPVQYGEHLYGAEISMVTYI